MRLERFTPECRSRRRHIVARDDTECASFMKKEVAEFSLAEPHGVRQDGLEHRRQLAGRRTDDAQHLRCCFLSLQRFVALSGELSKVGLCFVLCR
jgi:hypothetical protein